MTPEEFARELSQALGPALRSVTLYGSAAAGDHLGKASDFNILAVSERLGLTELRAVVPATKRWRRNGNPPPMMMTLQGLQRSCDIFPIEIIDIRESHRVLYGDDVIDGLEVDPENLRLQLERELKAKLISLRESYLLGAGRRNPTLDLMKRSVVSFLILAKAALRLLQSDIPKQKLAAFMLLADQFGLDPSPFSTAFQLKEGSLRARGIDADALFADYLEVVERLVRKVDTLLQKDASGTSAVTTESESPGQDILNSRKVK